MSPTYNDGYLDGRKALRADHDPMFAELRTEIGQLRARVAELEADRSAAESLADVVEDFAFTTEKDIDRLRAAWQSYVETVDRQATDAGGAS